MANSIRTPRQGVTANSRRIAQAVDNESWQKFRVSMKGKSTAEKLDMLESYFSSFCHGHDSLGREIYHSQSKLCLEGECDVCIRVDNYIKALCRGGQLYGGESLYTAIMSEWKLDIKK